MLRITGGRVYDPANGVDGVVKEVLHREGDRVEAGDVVATLKDEGYRAALAVSGVPDEALEKSKSAPPAQKKLLDVAAQQMELNLKAAREAMETVNPFQPVALGAGDDTAVTIGAVLSMFNVAVHQRACLQRRNKRICCRHCLGEIPKRPYP